MKRIKNFWLGILAFALVFGISIACQQFVEEKKATVEDAQIPVITTEPAGYSTFRDVDPQPALTVAARVTDGGELTYHWKAGYASDYSDLASLPRGTDASYIPIFAEDEASPVYYRVTITNTNNKATKNKTASIDSEIAVVTLNNRADAQTPHINTQPQNHGYNDGDAIQAITVGVDALTDEGTLSYQWYSNVANSNSGGTLLPGATGISYTPTVTAVGIYYYYVVVTNNNPGATGNKTASIASNPVTITINSIEDAELPTITTAPASAEYVKDDTVTALSVTASVGTGALTYQWYSNTVNSSENGALISGQTSSIYTPATAAAGTSYYYVVVTNTDESKNGVKIVSISSPAVTIKVYPYDAASAPSIGTQPVGGDYYQSETVSLSITASHTNSSAALTYQWYESLTSTGTGTLLGGATSSTFSTPGTALPISTYFYYCIVTVNDPDAKTTKTATVKSDVVQVGIFTSIPASVGATVTVNTATKYQYVRGFGGMSSVSFRSGIGSASPDMTVSNINTMFNKTTGLGLNILRICMYDDVQKFIAGESGYIGAGSFGNAANEADYVDIVKKVNELGGYVLATPWTPPATYKTNNSLVGGPIDSTKFNALADNFHVAYLNFMVSSGAPVFAFTIQNEFDFTSQYEGATYTNAQMRDYIKVLGPKIQGIAGYGGGQATSQVWLGAGDTMGTMTQFDNTMSDSDAAGYTKLAAHHLYTSPGNTPYISAHTKGIETWQTEHSDTTGRSGTGTTMYNAMSGWNWVWHVMNETDYCVRILNDSAFVWWYSKRFYGFIGDGTYGTTDGAILPRGYAMSHWSKYAANTNRVAVTTSGTATFNPASFTTGNNDTAGSNTNGTQNNTTPKVNAFESLDGNSIIVIIFTPTRNDGSNGVNVGNVKIDFPTNFVVGTVDAIRSNATVKVQDDSANIILTKDRKAAYISMPSANLVSVKFTKQ